jgi:hypothetical protein
MIEALTVPDLVSRAVPDFVPHAAVWSGVERLLSEYAQLETADAVVIAYAPDSRTSAALTGAVCELRGVKPRYVPLRPLHDPGFRARLTFERETMSHHGDIRAHFATHSPDRYRVIRAINAGPDLFETGLAVGPAELSALNTALLERLSCARRLRIRTDAGTDLSVRLDNTRFHFVSNRGVAQPRQFVILPAGEVAAFPAQIDGTLVADFALNVNMHYEGDVRLATHPVRAKVVDGVLTEFRCESTAMSQFLERCFARPNGRRIGELGFGTNSAVRLAVPENSHLNERVPGVHLGFGQHNQSNALAGYECDVHVDLCAYGGRVWFDDDPLPIDLTRLEPSPRAHPAMVRDEDVFSEEFQVEDCCGILASSSLCSDRN